MSFTTRNLKQTATHWTATPDGYGGYTFGDPEELLCRWEAVSSVMRTPGGEELIYDAAVHLATDVAEGDYLYLGTSNEVDPSTLPGAGRVMKFRKVTDLRNLNISRAAYL